MDWWNLKINIQGSCSITPLQAAHEPWQSKQAPDEDWSSNWFGLSCWKESYCKPRNICDYVTYDRIAEK